MRENKTKKKTKTKNGEMKTQEEMLKRHGQSISSIGLCLSWLWMCNCCLLFVFVIVFDSSWFSCYFSSYTPCLSKMFAVVFFFLLLGDFVSICGFFLL